jgi:hypothetical protein
LGRRSYAFRVVCGYQEKSALCFSTAPPLVISQNIPPCCIIPVIRTSSVAANLGELARAGLPVPAGFCVTTAAYNLVVERAGLPTLLAELTTTSAADTPHLPGQRRAGYEREIRRRHTLAGLSCSGGDEYPFQPSPVQLSPAQILTTTNFILSPYVRPGALKTSREPLHLIS